MDIGLLIVRVVVGLLFVGHGAQKLFGWFGGYGLRGTSGWLESLGFRPGKPAATLAGLTELGAGVLLVLGLLTPLAAAAVIGIMVAAWVVVHHERGVWVTEGGFEYPLVLIAIMALLAFAGPGGYSLDAAIGWDVMGIGWGLGALALGILAGLALPAIRSSEAGEAGEERRAA